MDAARQIDEHTAQAEVKVSARDVQVYYGATHAIKDVSVDIADKTVTAFIGPSGCGKSTFLRCINRMNDTIDVARIEGDILLDGEDIYDPAVDPVQLRARVGMVFQKPNPFPKSKKKWPPRTTFFLQGARVSQKTAFFHLGNLVEYGDTGQIFTNPQDPRTESYITGRIG
ncbi:ATP-binding cassette domain-containing protein [Aestuariivita sp.]|uniref:phosphate ABC transporter ATP-binding protein n=1 Tax=Aestuariivita sp. TaxID=1872407 RepID=UPI00216D3402|nr:ATP-binding cassette domain-containing protein [Aestuariivita sp.]MCE8005686.1 ATP-binding cassette domain-containing protein [Aestuariivita sp.]